jgi:hypothetical protein
MFSSSISFRLKITEAIDAASKELPKGTTTHNGFRRMTKSTIFANFLLKFPAAFRNSLIWVPSGFWKLFCHCTRDFSGNHQELVSFFLGAILTNIFKYLRNCEEKRIIQKPSAVIHL